ncbi:hypothetical protein GCM10023322_07160 [Rugosimonospora acidiphila]|uniref:Uncharacterized protein n=1 Tax=Rugosimonospora acidiphila TaxID=556531 RepID=A0ABP9RK89_9ACTN
MNRGDLVSVSQRHAAAEALVLQERFADLFTDDERETARRRLKERGYLPPCGG